jgi:hypothetical protein
MRRFRKFRDDRFALTTLQNPTWEVRTRAQLIEAAQKALGLQPDVADLPTDPPPGAPQPAPAAPAPQNPPAEQTLQPPNYGAIEFLVPVTHPVAKAAKVTKTKPSRKPKRRSKQVQLAELVPDDDDSEYLAQAFDGRFTTADIPHRDGESALAALERHARKCVICNHPDRADLEEDFVSWRNAELIFKDYALPNFRAIYRHARATGLYQRRRENLRFAAELIIEHADQAQPTPDAILRAIQICARLNSSGDWVEPPKRVIFTSGPNLTVAEPASQTEPVFGPEHAPQQLPSENAPDPQFSAPVDTSSDERNPQFLIDTPAIRK